MFNLLMMLKGKLMEIYSVQINKEGFYATPERERAFFISIAHLANEIHALLRSLLYSHNTPAQNNAEENGRVTLTLMFAKLLAGKV